MEICITDTNRVRESSQAYACFYDELSVKTGYKSPDMLALAIARVITEYQIDKPSEPALVCDAGIGTGLFALALYQRVAGLKFIGLDVSEAMMGHAHDKIEGLTSFECDMQTDRWPVMDEACAIVGACSVLPYIARKDHFFAEANRILQKGGLLAFTYEPPQEALPGQTARHCSRSAIFELIHNHKLHILCEAEAESHTPLGAERPVLTSFVVARKPV